MPTQPLGYQPLIYFWKVFNNLHYFLLCSPFRLEIRKSQNITWVVARSCLPQKVICAIVTFCGVAYCFGGVIQAVPRNYRNPSQYINFGLFINRLFSMLIRINLLWFHQAELVEMLNLLLQKQYSIPAFANVGTVKFILGRKGKILNIIVILVLLAIELEVVSRNRFATMVNFGRRSFFLGNKTTETVDKIVGVTMCLGHYWRTTLSYFQATCMVLIAVILWLPSRVLAARLLWDVGEIKRAIRLNDGTKFEKSIQILHKSWQEFKTAYKAVMNLSNLINRLYGVTVFSFLIHNLLYQSTMFDLIFASKSRRLAVLIHVIFTLEWAFAFWLSAGIGNQVSYILLV